MCIIVAKPAGAIVTLDTLKNCWDSNPHGAGLAVACEGKVEIIKGLMSWAEFSDVYDEPEFWRDMPMLIHFRIRTHGASDEENTHPFEVFPRKLAFAHNGVMSDMVVKDRPDLSDTQVFNRYILQQLPQNFLQSAAMRRLIESAISYNKLAFLDGAGKITIFNEEAGSTREDGVWFSNRDYLGITYIYQDWYARNREWVLKDDGQWRSRSSFRPLPVTCEATNPVDKDDEDYLEEDEFYCWDCAQAFDAKYDPIFADYTPACPSCGSSAAVETFEEAYRSNAVVEIDIEDAQAGD